MSRPATAWLSSFAHRAAADGTHHVHSATGLPLYARRFAWVLPFHEPGLAPVGASGAAWHIRLDGSDSYAARHRRTFGYYGGLAAVQASDGAWRHVDADGAAAYAAGFAWAGNFQGGRCAVRRTDGSYVHIDAVGASRTGGPYAYAGDYREGLAVVRSARDGLARHVDADGAPPPGAPPGRGWLDLDVFHKSFARARDERGWHMVRRHDWSDACGGVRYAALEPFYNGQACATRLDGGRCIIGEEGRTVMDLPPAAGEADAAAQALATGYWSALALRAGLLEDVPTQAAAAGSAGLVPPDGSRLAAVAAAWAELGLLLLAQPPLAAPPAQSPPQQHGHGGTMLTPPAYVLTPAGAALARGSHGRARAEYWLQPRYLDAWLPGRAPTAPVVGAMPLAGDALPVDGQPTCAPAAPDTFEQLAAGAPDALRLSRDVLASYARSSWAGVEAHVAPLLDAAAQRAIAAGGRAVVTVVDVGGGTGELLRRLRTLPPLPPPCTLRLVCVDRPEVTALNLAEQARALLEAAAAAAAAAVEFVAADALAEELPPGADVYVLARVLHDWDDARACALLRTVRRAAAYGTEPTAAAVRLVVLDRVATAGRAHALLSLHMHLLNGGRERRRDEWQRLFAQSGWQQVSTAMHDDHAVMVLRPADEAVAVPHPPSAGSSANPARRAAPATSGGSSSSSSSGRALPPPQERDCRVTSSGGGDGVARGVLLVNHGYPPDFNAGSEIDTQTTALGLRARGGDEFGDVAVFAREADVFAPDYGLRVTADALDGSIPVYLVNNPREAAYSRYDCAEIDDVFRRVMAARRPRVVHFGHVNHLSVGLPRIAKDDFGARVVFTLHDYFIDCPRGTFLVQGPAPMPYARCTAQVDTKCAELCFARRFGGPDDGSVRYWTDWVRGRTAAFRVMAGSVDAFTAPSRHLLAHFAAAGIMPANRLHFLPYGFDHARLAGRTRTMPAAGAPYVFAYIGRHEPSKGIQLLVEAAFRLARSHASSPPPPPPPFRVVIYGRDSGASTAALRRLIAAGHAADPSLPAGLVSFAPEYRNQDIVPAVFNAVDCIVVPSIWAENSPLVIHEAQQARVLVVTADVGGMAELVTDGLNGTLFKHRDAASLADALWRVLADPARAAAMAAVGYVTGAAAGPGAVAAGGAVPSAVGQVDALLALYRTL